MSDTNAIFDSEPRNLIFEYSGRNTMFVDKRSARCSSDDLVFRIAKVGMCPKYAPTRKSHCCELNKGDKFNKNLLTIANAASTSGELDGVFEWAKEKMSVDGIKRHLPWKFYSSNYKTRLELNNFDEPEDEYLYLALLDHAEPLSLNINYTVSKNFISPFESLPRIQYPMYGRININARSTPVDVTDVPDHLWSEYWADSTRRNVQINVKDGFVRMDMADFIVSAMKSASEPIFRNILEHEDSKLSITFDVNRFSSKDTNFNRLRPIMRNEILYIVDKSSGFLNLVDSKISGENHDNHDYIFKYNGKYGEYIGLRLHQSVSNDRCTVYVHSFKDKEDEEEDEPYIQDGPRYWERPDYNPGAYFRFNPLIIVD